MAPRKVATREEEVSSEDDLMNAGSRAVAKPVKKTAAKTGKRKAPTSTRPALQDKTNVQAAVETVPAIQDDLEKPKTKKAKISHAVAQTKSAAPPKSKSVEMTIPETQLEQRQHDEAEEEPTTSVPVQRPASVQPQHAEIDESPAQAKSRSKSSYTKSKEKEADLKSELQAVTAECSRLRGKYAVLDDVCFSQGKLGFDKLKEESDRKTQQADAVIWSLKQERNVLRESLLTTSNKAKAFKEQLDTIQDEKGGWLGTIDRLQEALEKANEQYKKCEAEKNAAESKLVVARQQSTTIVQDNRSQSARTTGINKTEAQREAEMKENLYTDLTGLIIRGIKRKDGEDEYDCIQTGRNGTLHFHLTVANDNSSNPKTPGGPTYEEAEFAYEPFLDNSRDKDLLELLPEYLAEEICFPRNHAVKFYSKVVESMTKRITVEK